MRKRSSQPNKSSTNSAKSPEPKAQTSDGDMAVRFSPTRRLGYLIGLVVLCTTSYLYLIPLLSSQRLDSKLAVTSTLPADIPKRDAIVDTFKHAWHAYERDAMGSDEYHPISKQGSNLSKTGGIGYTVTDAIDTMYIMGLKDEYSRARKWVAEKLTFDREGNFNTFETTIRVLGGLLSSHHLTSDKIFLERAVDLADRMLPAFNTPHGLPLPSVDLANRVGIPDQWSPQLISTAEAATLQLEFRYLSELTQNPEYWHKVENVMSVINKAKLPHNLVPIHMSTEQGVFIQSEIRLGSRGDSYYEYLLKQYLQTARTQPIYQKMYDDAMKGIHDNLIMKSPTKKLTHTSELIPHMTANGLNWERSPKQDHLVCFLAGSLMLGATTSGARGASVSIPPKPEELTPQGLRDWNTGKELLEACMATHETSTGLSPEIVVFKVAGDNSPKSDRDWYIKNSQKGGPSSYDARYMLRPETIESLFLAWRLTGDIRYRNYAWGIYTSIEKHCRVATGGYATVLDVDTVPVTLEDKQETFFLSETLKYLYLIFSDSNVIPLKDYVFNTEAHPLPVFKPTIKPTFF